MSAVTLLLAAAAGPATTVAAAQTPAADQGYLYNLVRHLGGSDFVARTVQVFVVKPLVIILVLVAALIVARLGGRIAQRYLRSVQRRSARHPGRIRSPQRLATVTALVTSIWRVTVWVIAVLIALETIGVNLTPLLAGATVLGAAIGFGAQSLIRDFLSGVFIVAEDQYGIGDTIRVGSTSGVVEELSLRITRLRDADGTVWYVRNGEISQVGNESLNWARAVVDVVVPSGTDLERASAAISEEAVAMASEAEWVEALLEDPVLLGVEAQDAATVTIRVAARTAVDKDAAVARSLRGRITARLDREGILEPPGSATG